MHIITLPIDTKSLYYNIFNDNEHGHTCTVATPIKQGNSLRKELNEIFKIPKQIDFLKEDTLLKDLIKNSKSIVKINNVFVFDKIKVNNEKINIAASFCMYVKEEIDSSKIQYGRIKLHYPLSLKNQEYEIDNKKIIEAISNHLNGYAFIVESFDYCFDDDYLNFNIVIVGYNNIPYSKVFINNKGAGSKYNVGIENYLDNYDIEIKPLRVKFGFDINVNNFKEYFVKARDLGYQYAIKYIESIGGTNIRKMGIEYPYSVFDIQYTKDNKVYYLIIRATYTKIKYADLPANVYGFFNTFDNCKLFILTDCFASNAYFIYDSKDAYELSNTICYTRLIDRR